MSTTNQNSTALQKRAVLYARVSTDEQGEKGYSLPSQLETCRNYADSKGYAIVDEITDEFTGTQLDRPGLGRVRSMIKQHQIDALIVFSTDRLTRKLGHLLAFREELNRANIELHFCNRGQSDDTPENRMTENIEGVFNEYWREKIIEANRRGKITKARSGKWVGISTPYGYRKVGQRNEARMEINEDEAAIVHRIFDMYLGRNGYNRYNMLGIAKALTAENIPISGRGRKSAKGWTDGTIRYILRNTAYIGKFKYCGVVIEMSGLAILDGETFQAAQIQRQKNGKKAKRNRKYDYLVAGGHIKCSCGRWMVARTAHDKRHNVVYQYYSCSNQRRRYLYGCEERHLRADIADQLIWQWLYKLLSDKDYLEAGIEEMIERHDLEIASDREQLVIVEDLLSQLEKKIRRLAAAYGEAEDDEVASALNFELKQAGRERSELIEEQARLVAKIGLNTLTPEEIETIKRTAAELREEIDEADFATKRLMVDKINVQVQVQYDDEGRRQLKATCEIKMDPDYLSVEQSRLRPVTISEPCRNCWGTRMSAPP